VARLTFVEASSSLVDLEREGEREREAGKIIARRCLPSAGGVDGGDGGADDGGDGGSDGGAAPDGKTQPAPKSSPNWSVSEPADWCFSKYQSFSSRAC